MRSGGEYLGLDGFVWFFGVIEDIDDPLNVGRVRVRCYGWHTDNKAEIPTNSLPWAQVILPVTSASISGIGRSPTGLLCGSTVIGFFLDGKNAQQPMVFGTIPGIPKENPNNGKGFWDPLGVYPKFSDRPDTPNLAYDQWSSDIITLEKDSNRVTSIPTASRHFANSVIDAKSDVDYVSGPGKSKLKTWDEPKQRIGDSGSGSNSVYPANHVHQTESGHAFEVDDTKGSERIHQYHMSGTFYEIQPTGDRVTKIRGDDYEICAQDKNVLIKGDCNVTVEGNVRLRIDGDFVHEVLGNYYLMVHGDHITKINKNEAKEIVGNKSTQINDNEVKRITKNNTLVVGGDASENINGEKQVVVNKNFNEITLTNFKRLSVGNTANISLVSMNLAAGGGMSISSGTTTSFKSTTAAAFTFGTTLNYSVAGVATYDYNGVYNIRYDSDFKEHIGANTYKRHDGGVDYACSSDPARTTGNSCETISTARVI